MANASEKNVLVVDDEPDVRNFIAACIEDTGFKVEKAVDGVDALEKIQASIPDLITLDMVMPRSNGINFMRKLRKNEAWSTIPVIVITAHANDEFGSEDIAKFEGFATNMRPKYVMEKPITPEKLVKAICDILEVEAEEKVLNDKDEIIQLLNNSDADTLKKIKAVLNK